MEIGKLRVIGKKQDTFIFDLDGTLIDAYKGIADAFNHTMTVLGYPRQEYETIKRQIGRGVEMIFLPFIRENDLDRAIAIYLQKYEEVMLREVTLMKGARELLDSLLNKGFKLAVASNKNAVFSEPILQYLSVRDYFHTTLYGDQIERMKPDPQILFLLMEKLGSEPAKTVYIGDMAVDIETGRRAGALTIAVPTGSNSRREIEQAMPDYILNNLEELKSLIEG